MCVCVCAFFFVELSLADCQMQGTGDHISTSSPQVIKL